MQLRLAMIPHLQKTPVRDLPEGWDRSDPPITEESFSKVAPLTDQLFAELGPPTVIATAPQLRCVQTASEAIERWGDYWAGYLPVITLNTLCQPDNGDHDPDNPAADENGLVFYGRRTIEKHWCKAFDLSLDLLAAIAFNQIDDSGRACVWAFTSRPIAAAARFRAGCTREPGEGEINTLDPTLFPYTVFDYNPVGFLIERERVA